MPGFDRTGPEGRGPMTGRGAGYCAGKEIPPVSNREFGYGRGRMRGFGRGFGFGWGRREEIQSLKNQSNQLQNELDRVNKRVQELEADKDNEK